MAEIPDVTRVKTEPLDPVHLEDTILKLCRDNPKGITDSLLQEKCPGISVEQRLKALQRLLSMVLYLYYSLVIPRRWRLSIGDYKRPSRLLSPIDKHHPEESGLVHETILYSLFKFLV